MRCWGLTDGSAGMEAQVKALAQALGVVPEMKRVSIAFPWVALPNAFYATPLKYLLMPYGLRRDSDALTPPAPDLVISCGRRGAMAALGLRARAGSTTRFINIQDPHIDPRHFDIVVAMQHDGLSGPNVISTRFALHNITAGFMRDMRERFVPKFASYPNPKVAVLIGGSTNKYRLTGERMMQIVTRLQTVVSHMTGSLLITPSRRTGLSNLAMLKSTFAGHNRVYIYDFIGENPYRGMLALADIIVVTNDSVNMMSDAYATGKPLYIMKLPGHVNTKPARFAEALIAEGAARTLGSGKLETWSYKVDNEMQRLAAEIRQRLNL